MLTKDELISRARAILVVGKVRKTWRMNPRMTQVYPLMSYENDINAEVVEKLKELFDGAWTE